MKIIALSICLFISQLAFGTTYFDIKSKQTGDTYKIYIDLPTSYHSSNQKFPVVYYADANLKSGIKMRKIAKQLIAEKKIKDCILVGIGHYGNYQQKRRRDFIQAHQKNKAGEWYSNDKNYGQSELFYQFLKKELLPNIEKKYRASSKNRTLSGHSLSGLFTVYAMLKTKPIFDNYIALSPSLWVNYQNVYSFEKLYWAKQKTLKRNIFITSGSLEIANLILFHVNDFTTYIKLRKYKKLNYKKKIYAGKTHNSAVPRGLNDGLLFALKR